MSDLAKKLLPIFLAETEPRLEAISQLIERDNTGKNSLEELKAAYRAAHTIKGTAGLVKLPATQMISSQIEEILKALLKRRRNASPKVKDALRIALEHLRQQVAAAEAGTPENPQAPEQVKALFDQFRSKPSPTLQAAPAVSSAQAAVEPCRSVTSPSEPDASLDPQAPPKEPAIETDNGHNDPQEQPGIVNICCQFHVSGKTFSLPMADMVEIGSLTSVIPLPLAPAYIRGLLNLRGQVMPVIDLDPLHGAPIRPLSNRHLVIAEISGDRLAFLTDGIPALAPEFIGETINLCEFVHRYGIKAD